jgi:hypothetical protein
MKTRKHHNNKGLQQIKTGSVKREIIRIAKKYKIPYGRRKK